MGRASSSLSPEVPTTARSRRSQAAASLSGSSEAISVAFDDQASLAAIGEECVGTAGTRSPCDNGIFRGGFLPIKMDDDPGCAGLERSSPSRRERVRAPSGPAPTEAWPRRHPLQPSPQPPPSVPGASSGGFRCRTAATLRLRLRSGC